VYGSIWNYYYCAIAPGLPRRRRQATCMQKWSGMAARGSRGNGPPSALLPAACESVSCNTNLLLPWRMACNRPGTAMASGTSERSRSDPFGPVWLAPRRKLRAVLIEFRNNKIQREGRHWPRDRSLGEMDAASRRRQTDLLLKVCTTSSSLSSSESSELLRLLRQSGQSLQHAHLVCELGSSLIQHGWLGDEGEKGPRADAN